MRSLTSYEFVGVHEEGRSALPDLSCKCSAHGAESLKDGFGGVRAVTSCPSTSMTMVWIQRKVLHEPLD